MENREQHFDSILKAKIDIPFDHGMSSSWNVMKDALNHNLPLAEDKQFDEIIKDKVSDIAQPSVTKSWMTFQSRLDKETLQQEKTFDKIIYKKLAFLNNGQLANWPLFLGQLEDWEHLRRRIISSRILEAFIMVTVLLFSYQYSAQQRRAKFEKETITNNQMALIQSPIENKSIDISNDHQADLLIQNREIKNQEIKNLSATKSHDNILPQSLFSETLREVIERSPLSLSVNDDSHNRIVGESEGYIVSNEENNSLTNASVSALTSDAPKVDLLIDHADHINNKEFLISTFELDPLDGTPMTGLSMDRDLRVKTITLLSDVDLFSSHKDGLSIAIAASLDAHYIATPRDREFNLSPFERFNNGYGLSVRINKKKGRFNLETGLAYHYIDYKPKELIIIEEGSFTKGVYKQISHTRTEMHFMEVPLDIQYNLFTNSKIRMYASMGASANMNIISDYEFERSTQKISSRKPVRHGFIVDSRNNTLRDLRDYSDGILQGGSIIENSYLTGNLGFGIDYSLNKNANLFTQVIYHHRLGNKGIGPNEDRFHLTSFNLGLRLPLSPGY